jgi:REP element-mobilizing transposase RayT
MTVERYKIVDAEYPHFLTPTIKDWYPLFARPEIVAIVLNSLKYLQKEGLIIYAYVIMENHMHLVAKSNRLEDDIQRFKAHTGLEIVKQLKMYNQGVLHGFSFINNLTRSEHKIWESGNHPVMIQNEEMMHQKIEYIHANPVRRGYVDEATDWRYSSARNYSDLPGLLDVETNWNV